MAKERKFEKNFYRVGSRVWLLVLCLMTIAILFPKIIPTGIVSGVVMSSVAVILAFYALINFKRMDLADLLIAMTGVFIVGLTFFAGNLSSGILVSTAINVLYVVMIRNELRKSILILDVIFGVTVFVVLATLLATFSPSVGPDGYEWYLIGGKNALAIALLPAMGAVLVRSYVIHGRVGFIEKILALTVIVTVAIGGSSTGLVGAVLLGLIVFLKRFAYLSKILLLCYPILQAMLYNAAVIFSIPLIAFIVSDVLGKSLTLTHRTDIWLDVIDAIEISPIFGYGRDNGIVSANFDGLYEAHNLTLEIMMTGGVVLLSVLAYIMIKFLTLKMQSPEGLYLRSMIGYVLFLVLVIGLTESILFQNGFWLIIGLTMSITMLEKHAITRRLSRERVGS